jgi:hypothetical protein
MAYRRCRYGCGYVSEMTGHRTRLMTYKKRMGDNPYNIRATETGVTGKSGGPWYKIVSDKYTANVAVSYFFYVYGYAPSNVTKHNLTGWWKLGPFTHGADV